LSYNNNTTNNTSNITKTNNINNQENETWSQSHLTNRSIMNTATIVDQWSSSNHQLDDILFEPKQVNNI
jgi:hypothetical protein